ncbi:hypothetical protein [Pseudomonas syringae pv. coryli]|uniref:hypothetical protein n=1 Tax=Pseudomonas syringae pv. coryli TaxID=317659 RepID=UPI003D29EE6E
MNSSNGPSPQSDPAEEPIRTGLEFACHAASGVMLGFIVYLSILSRSLALATSMLLLMGFLMVPSFAGFLRKQRMKALRVLGTVVLFGWFGMILNYMASMADHLYMVNGSSYPKWLVENVSIRPDEVFTVGGPNTLCAGYGTGMFYRKDNGVFLRCGSMGGSQKTYFIDNYDEAYSAWKSAQESRK